jgi:hypothetical protein
MKLSKRKTLPNLIAFLILSGCQSSPKPVTKFDGKWEFCEVRPQVQMACLAEEDVKELRKLLIECKNAKP